MTVDTTPNDIWPTYEKCGRPAKFRVPHPKMKVEFVCGIHAQSINKTLERIGSNDRCILLNQK